MTILVVCIRFTISGLVVVKFIYLSWLVFNSWKGKCFECKKKLDVLEHINCFLFSKLKIDSC